MLTESLLPLSTVYDGQGMYGASDSHQTGNPEHLGVISDLLLGAPGACCHCPQCTGRAFPELLIAIKQGIRNGAWGWSAMIGIRILERPFGGCSTTGTLRRTSPTVSRSTADLAIALYRRHGSDWVIIRASSGTRQRGRYSRRRGFKRCDEGTKCTAVHALSFLPTVGCCD